MDIGEAFCARMSALIEEVRGYMQQLPDGPELEQLRQQLGEMERILEERFGVQGSDWGEDEAVL